MSMLQLLSMPTASPRGDLRLVEKDHPKAFGHFLLKCSDLFRKDAVPLRVYFAYEFSPLPADIAQDHIRDAIKAELLRFYNSITLIQSFNPYVLDRIDIPFGFPISFKDLSLDPA